MINKQEFNSIKKDLEKFEDGREELIQKARDLIKLSKQIIYSVHRDDFKHASSLVREIKKKFKNFPKENYDTNLHVIAKQEYVEALAYYEFVKNKKIPTREELNIDTESFLLGLCDLTGELVRKAVRDVIKKKLSEVNDIRELVEEIHGEFLKFDLRNSELRKKSDAIKWNLKKLEDLVFSIKK